MTAAITSTESVDRSWQIYPNKRVCTVERVVEYSDGARVRRTYTVTEYTPTYNSKGTVEQHARVGTHIDAIV